MATYREIQYNLMNLPTSGISSDDYNPSPRQLMFIFNYYRSAMIRRELNKGQRLSGWMIQQIPCFPMECVDRAECCDEFTGCIVMKSVDKVPSVIKTYDKDMLTYVGSIDKKCSFPLTSETQARYQKYNKFTSSTIKSFIRDGYLYLTNTVETEIVTIEGVFDDPMAIAKYKTCTGDPCFTLDSEYPLPEYLIEQITDAMMQGEMRMLNATLPDEFNDAQGRSGDFKPALKP